MLISLRYWLRFNHSETQVTLSPQEPLETADDLDTLMRMAAFEQLAWPQDHN